MLSVPSALLLELGAIRHAAGGLHAEAMDDQGDSFDAENGSGNGARLELEVADVQIAMTLEEREC